MKKHRKIDKAIFDILKTISEQSEGRGQATKSCSYSLDDLIRNAGDEDVFLVSIIKICFSKEYLEQPHNKDAIFMTEKGVEFFNKEKKRKQRDWVKIISDFLIEYKGFFLLIGLLSSAAILYFRIFHFLPNHTHDHHTHINLSEHSQIKSLK